MLHHGIHTLPEGPPRLGGAYDISSSRSFRTGLARAVRRRVRRTRVSRSRVPGGGVVRPAFTLLELLVVVAIIVVLATLLLPVLAMMRANCAQVVCSSRLKELVIACQLYARSNGDRYPLPAGDGQSAPVPNLLPVRLLNDVHPYAGYPPVEPGVAAASLPPAVQCPLLEDVGAGRGPIEGPGGEFTMYYTGYAYLGGLGPAAGPVAAPGLSAPSRRPLPRVPMPGGGAAAPRGVMAKAPSAPFAGRGASGRTTNSAAAPGSPRAPGLPGAPGTGLPGAPPVAGVALKAGSAAAKLGDGGVLWADDVSLSAPGEDWRFAHARSGADPGTKALTYAKPTACLGQHRGYADASVKWVPAHELMLGGDEAAGPGIFAASVPAEPAASYKAGSSYWWF